MKAILTSTLFLLSLFVQSQTWSPAGATWNFNYINFAVQGRTELSYVGDTVIAGQPCKRIQKMIIGYDFISHTGFTYDLGDEYTYDDNGVIYFLDQNNQWDTLFNFNANIGDEWLMPRQPSVSAGYCDSNGVITVMDTGTMIINTVSLRYKVVEFNVGQSMSYPPDTLVEKIGYLNTYWFPYDECEGALDGNEGGPLRCYYDDAFGTYQRFWFNNACDYVSLDEKVLDGKKELVRIVDTLGRETKDEPNKALIYIYSDGTTERIFRLK